MNNKLFSITIIVLVLCILPACQTVKSNSYLSSKVHHVVICWLKDSGNEEARHKIIDVSRQFSSIPGVIDVKAGSVLPSGREIVDSSFDVGIYLTFENKQDLHDYLIHPIHKNAVEEVLKPLVLRIVVYDFIE